MARIFITGSTDGLGLYAALNLIAEEHDVVLHARNERRADDVRQYLPETSTILTADLSDIEATIQLAEAVNTLGKFDAIIHNAAVYQATNAQIFAVNLLAPYLLTALIRRPERLVYIGSNMHLQGATDPGKLSPELGVSYSDSKLLLLLLAQAVALKWPDSHVNTVDPGWVPTKMGGPSAPDDLQKGTQTQVWLASSKDATLTGKYLFHMKEASYAGKADDEALQEQLLKRCEAISGIRFPADETF